MKLANILLDGAEVAVIIEGNRSFPLSRVNHFRNTGFPEHVISLIREDKLIGLSEWFRSQVESRDFIRECSLKTGSLTFLPPFYSPEKIWGIGLNYAGHALDLKAKQPDRYPAGFNKPPTTIIGHNETIIVPELSGRTTAEAELGIIIGREARNIKPEKWKQYVAGFVPVIDVTSLDILKLNPRYLSLSKSFDTFFSFGPVMITPEEFEDIGKLKVATWHNGEEIASNTVDHMRFSPAFLVGFMSRIFTMKPGDIISTGTPGAAEIKDGDIVEAKISGFPVLKNDIKSVYHGSET
ncbi:MAG: fumarylacetoacetate hydrolase family protein [Chlorobi bacterium]|nr:fumarylacetoacetate hydrolase family protein [Chlorobiota bacterium]